MGDGEELKRIIFKNGSTITFKPYRAGQEKFQGPRDHFMLIEDGPEFYRWWEMPLYWWRILAHQIAKRF